jgi:hypothetical protein
MNATDKLNRALADDPEFVGDKNTLCLILRAEVYRLRQALKYIVHAEPWTDGGNCVYEHADADGNYMGFQNVDPLGVIGFMVSVAHKALET